MAIILTLILGLSLRLISLNQSLWLDEATTALVAKMSLSDFFTKFISNDFHPPLYYLILHFWTQMFGISEILLRIPSVLFGLLNIYFVYLIGKEIKLKWAVLPSLLLATSGLHIYYSQEARMYSLAALLVTVVVYTFIKKKWLWFSITLSLLFLADYLSILILPALIFYTIFFNRKNIKSISISLIPLFITITAWLPFFIKQILSGISLKENASAWWNILGPVTFKNILLIPTKFMIGRVTLDNKIVYYILVSLILLLVTYLLSKAKNKLTWSWLGVCLVLGIAVSFFIPTLTYFRYLFVLPAFYLLISERTNKFLIAVVLLINIATSGMYLFLPKFHREDWRNAAISIENEKVVFPVSSQKEGLIYYGKENNIIAKEQITSKDKTIWLSRYVWNIFDSSDSTRKYIEDLGYNKVAETSFNGVVLYKYENSN